MRCIYRSLARLEAKQGQNGCDSIKLCNPSKFFYNPPKL